MLQEVEFCEADFKHEFAETSSEAVMFPKYREKYIEQTQKYIVKALEAKKMSCTIDLDGKTIEVATNRRTRDPFIFIKGVNFARLVSRGVGVEEAMKVLEDGYFCEVVDIKRLASTEKVFEKRRERLVGPKEMTLKAIEVLTQTHVLVHGKTVSIIGGFRGVEEARQIVVDCMSNIHPMHQIKRLVEKRKLEGDPSKSSEDWDRFLPQARKSSKRSKKKVAGRETGNMPEDAAKRKEDIEMETGEYFVRAEGDSEERARARESARQKRRERKQKEAEKYVVPEE